MNYLVINSENIVVNTIVWDGETSWTPPEGHIVVPSNGFANTGWSYVNGEFISPEQPEEVIV